jgi:uncharacterized protein (TIGR03435 family)
VTTTLAILTAIFNTLWQAAVLAGLVWVVLKRLRVNAATRCVIWWFVLATMLFLPVAPRLATRWHQAQAAPTMSHRIEDVSAADFYMSQPEADGQPAIVTLPENRAAKWPLAIVALWAAVLLYRLTRIGRSYFHLRGVKRKATRSELPLPQTGRSARLLVSREIASPMAVGFLHAAVIIPENLTEHITREELDQILLHEAGHLARRDDWWNLVARLLGAFLALHPIAWWILRQIENEREAACDDWVVARTGAVRPYAEVLAHMVELRWQRGDSSRAEALASGVFGRGSRIGDRIEMLLVRGREFSPRVSFGRVVAGVFGLCCLAAAGSIAPRMIAFAKTPAARHVTARPLLVAQAAPDTNARQANAPQKVSAPTFEVASIRPAAFSSDGYKAGFYAGAADSGCGVQKPSISGTLVSLPLASICNLIGIAYDLKGYEIVGAPSLPKASGMQASMALASEHPAFFYDIEARAPGSNAPTQEEVGAMLRMLLADRFQLKVHRDSRELSYYALGVAKSGTKLIPAKPDCQSKSDVVRGDGTLKGSSVHICNQSMDQLARIIGSRTDRPVLDNTGLTGNVDYDLRVEFDLSAGDDLNSIYLDAYQKQLGLSLESRKGPVDVLVVDHVEPPSGN